MPYPDLQFGTAPLQPPAHLDALPDHALQRRKVMAVSTVDPGHEAPFQHQPRTRAAWLKVDDARIISNTRAVTRTDPANALTRIFQVSTR